MHTCKMCQVTFRAKVDTKLPKHQGGSCGGRCLGGKDCKGCA